MSGRRLGFQNTGDDRGPTQQHATAIYNNALDPYTTTIFGNFEYKTGSATVVALPCTSGFYESCS